MKNIVVLGFCIALSFGTKASEIVLRDSVGIEKVGDKSFIIHQVEERETLFGISRRYQVAVNDILQNNEQLQDGLKLGQRIKVPFIAKAVLPTGAKLHKVEPGETMFAISKKYNVSVEDILSGIAFKVQFKCWSIIDYTRCRRKARNHSFSTFSLCGHKSCSSFFRKTDSVQACHRISCKGIGKNG